MHKKSSQIFSDPIEVWVEEIPETMFCVFIFMIVNIVSIERIFTI